MECRELLGEFEDLNDSPDAVYRELSYSQQVRCVFFDDVMAWYRRSQEIGRCHTGEAKIGELKSDYCIGYNLGPRCQSLP